MASADTTDRWGAVLDAADDLIRKRGAEGWSLADLADRVDLPAPEVEAELGSEWEVFCRAIRRDEERWEAAIREAPHKNASDRIMNLLRACVPDYDWTLWIELWSLALRDASARQVREELDQNFRGLVEELIREGVDSGEFSVLDTRSAAITIATLIDTMALQATLGDTTVRPNYMLDACVTVSGVLLGTSFDIPELMASDK